MNTLTGPVLVNIFISSVKGLWGFGRRSGCTRAFDQEIDDKTPVGRWRRFSEMRLIGFLLMDHHTNRQRYEQQCERETED